MEYSGTFYFNGKIAVSDPCYKVNEHYQEHKLNGVLEVLPGKYEWGVEINQEINEVTGVFIIHEDYDVDNLSIETIEDFDVGVDSGLAGFYDYNFFLKYHNEKLDENWYNKNIIENGELHKNKYGTLMEDKVPVGFISETGIGDGTYPCLVLRNSDGNIVCAYIDYEVGILEELIKNGKRANVKND